MSNDDPDIEQKRKFFEKILVRSGKSKKDKKEEKVDELAALYKQPKKEQAKEIPRNLNITANSIYQADVLYLPEDPDTHQKYLLVVVDSASGMTDAFPMKQVTQKSVTDGFKKILDGKYLKIPKYMSLDGGSEFQGDTLKYLNSKNINVKVGVAGRSRQQSYAESRNKSIAKALFMRQSAQELLTDETDTHWVADLPLVS